MPTNRSHSFTRARQNVSTSQSRAPKSSIRTHFHPSSCWMARYAASRKAWRSAPVELRKTVRTGADFIACRGTKILQRCHATYNLVRGRGARCRRGRRSETGGGVYPKSGRSSRGISTRIDRPRPGIRSMKPLASNVTTIWCTDGGDTWKYLCIPFRPERLRGSSYSRK